MLKIEVNFSDEGLISALEKMSRDVEAPTELHEAMAVGVAETVRSHLLERNTRSPNTGFYAKASRSVESSWDADAALVTVPHRGAALRHSGGRVNMKDRFLALPTAQVPIRGDERLRPREMKDLAFIPKRGGPSVTIGFLVEGKKNKKGNRLIPKSKEEGGKLMFVLRAWTDHQADAEVIPSDAALTTRATEAGENYLTATLNTNRLA